MLRNAVPFWMLSIVLLACSTSEVATAAELAMGFRVGEVTHDSAVVWTRITKNKQRNWDGVREPSKREPRVEEYVPSKTRYEDREGATPGADGQIRVIWNRNDVRSAHQSATEWTTAKKDNDYIHKFQLTDLMAGASYSLRVECRAGDDQKVSASHEGTFTTPAKADQWQDTTFTVVTGQSYWDLDHKEGYHIYPAMAKLNPQFMIPTGDTVYLDSESPRARTIELARYHWHRMYSLPRHVAFHSKVPGYWEVDDHDSWCNDCWPTMKAKWMNPLTFEQAFKIYLEQNPMGKDLYRTFRWGKGLQVWVVEGRMYRSPNSMADGPTKTIWGKKQLAWLKRTIQESDADFRVLISPTPIVGPDRAKGKNDNHSNLAFANEGNHFRNWTKEAGLKNFYTCCGDRHWQYMSIDSASGLREFSCGPASDVHAGGNPKNDPAIQPFLRVKGGFLSVNVFKEKGVPTIAFRHHDVYGKVAHEFKNTSSD